MKGYCKDCKRKVQGRKKPLSIFFMIIGGFIFYGVYRILFIRKKRCPICGLKLSRIKVKKND